MCIMFGSQQTLLEKFLFRIELCMNSWLMVRVSFLHLKGNFRDWRGGGRRGMTWEKNTRKSGKTWDCEAFIYSIANNIKNNIAATVDLLLLVFRKHLKSRGHMKLIMKKIGLKIAWTFYRPVSMTPLRLTLWHSIKDSTYVQSKTTHAPINKTAHGTKLLSFKNLKSSKF